MTNVIILFIPFALSHHRWISSCTKTNEEWTNEVGINTLSKSTEICYQSWLVALVKRETVVDKECRRFLNWATRMGPFLKCRFFLAQSADTYSTHTFLNADKAPATSRLVSRNYTFGIINSWQLMKYLSETCSLDERMACTHYLSPSAFLTF